MNHLRLVEGTHVFNEYQHELVLDLVVPESQKTKLKRDENGPYIEVYHQHEDGEIHLTAGEFIWTPVSQDLRMPDGSLFPTWARIYFDVNWEVYMVDVSSCLSFKKNDSDKKSIGEYVKSLLASLFNKN